ncbi:MAG TPA: hypothetical protein VJA47_03965 [archaeon]|nr:hypothetical protein [archaeon]
MKAVAVVFALFFSIFFLAVFAQAQSLTKCTTAADCYKGGASYCTCNGAEKPYCLDGDNWRVNYYHCSKGVTSTDLNGYYCVLSSATSSQQTQYICDNGKSVNNNGYENGVWAGGADSCLDGKDNDYDGSIDCSDSDCSSTTSCLTCENGQLAVGRCSLAQQGLYCQSRNNLVDKCSSCGCPNLYYCGSGDKCIKDNPPTIVASITPSTNFAGLTFTLTTTISDDMSIASASWKGDKIFKDGIVIGCAGTSCSYSTPISTYISGSHTITISAIDSTGQKTEKTLTMTVNSCSTNSECGTDEWFGDTFCGSYNSTNYIYQYHRIARCSRGGCETGIGTDPKTPCAQGFICQHKTNLPGSTPKDAECVAQPTPTTSPTISTSPTTTPSATPTISTQPSSQCALNFPITPNCQCGGSTFSTGYCCSAPDSNGRQTIYQSSLPCSVSPPIVPPVIVNPPNTRLSCGIDADGDGNKCDPSESQVSCSADCGVSPGYASGCPTSNESRGNTYCGDGSCNINCNVQEDYWNCHLDCSPTPTTERPTNTPQPYESPPREPLRCGTIAGLSCPQNYRCDYGSGTGTPPSYPNAGGICIFEPTREERDDTPTTCSTDKDCGWYSANGCQETGALWTCGPTARNVLSEIASNKQCSNIAVPKPTQSCGCVQSSCVVFEGTKPTSTSRPIEVNTTERVIGPEKLLGLVINVEQLRIRFDYLAKRTRQLGKYYESANNSANAELWNSATAILTEEVSNIDKLKSKIKENVHNFTMPLLELAKVDVVKIVGSIDKVLDILLRGI